MSDDFFLEDEDLVLLSQKKFIAKLNFDTREVLDVEAEDFINIASLIDLLNGLTTEPVYVMRCLLKLSIVLKLMVKRVSAELSDKEIILNNNIGKLKYSYSLMDASNPYHGKLKITVESINSLVDINPSITALRRTLVLVKHKRDIMYALCDLVDKQIDISKSIMYLVNSNPEMRETKILSRKEVDTIVGDIYSSLKIERVD